MHCKNALTAIHKILIFSAFRLKIPLTTASRKFGKNKNKPKSVEMPLTVTMMILQNARKSLCKSILKCVFCVVNRCELLLTGVMPRVYSRVHCTVTIAQPNLTRSRCYKADGSNTACYWVRGADSSCATVSWPFVFAWHFSSPLSQRSTRPVVVSECSRSGGAFCEVECDHPTTTLVVDTNSYKFLQNRAFPSLILRAFCVY